MSYNSNCVPIPGPAGPPGPGGPPGTGSPVIVEDEGSAFPPRLTLNFVGSGVTVTDDGTRIIITIAGTLGGTQNEWTEDVDADNHVLFNVRRIGVGVASPQYALDVNGDVNITGTYRINGVAVMPAESIPGLSGTVNTNGTASVVWASGDKFTPDVAGKAIVIAGISYSLFQYVTPTQIGVNPAPPTASGAAYSIAS